jgi:putative transcriptional regulator
MKLKQVAIDPRQGSRIGRFDAARVDGTTEADIERHAADDDRDAMQDAAQFARRVRQRLGLSQTEFARRIDVSADTIRKWEQGKRSPTGAAKALLRLLYRAPELALQTLR